ncbi:MAG: hypothetical protein ABL995_02445 [Bryobacteraceae bacterium]
MLSLTIASVRTAVRRASLTFASALLVAAPILAHGGFEHVAGNVVKVSADTLTLQTSTGVVEVKLDAKTAITKEKQKAQRADLVTGARVVVDIPEGNKDKLAHAVKIGNAAPAAHEGHAGH